MSRVSDLHQFTTYPRKQTTGPDCKVNAVPAPHTWPSQAAAKREIQAAIDGNVQAVYKALLVIHSKQTQYEKSAQHTTEANGVGFGAFDAEFLSSLADKLTRFGCLTERQIEAARPKLRRYWKQLMRFSTEAAQGALH